MREAEIMQRWLPLRITIFETNDEYLFSHKKRNSFGVAEYVPRTINSDVAAWRLGLKPFNPCSEDNRDYLAHHFQVWRQYEILDEANQCPQ